MPNSTPNEPQASRPVMPSDYGIAPQATGQLPWAWAAEQLVAAKNYWIVSVRPDGRPHAMPVWGVALDGVVYFSTGHGSRKALNLAANPAVVVHLESGDETVVVEGTAVVVTDPAEIERFDDAYAAKYGGIRPGRDMGATSSIYRLNASAAFGWAETTFPTSATRWTFANKR
jgi:hypothetical protein